MADMVSKKLEEALDLPEHEENNKKQTGVSSQPSYSSSLVTDEDIKAYKSIEDSIGLEEYSKIVLMKTSQKAMQDHDELIETMGKVDDSKAARLAEVAVSALNSSSDAAKNLMNFTLQKEKLEVEKQKLEIKSVTINNNNSEGGGFNGSQKDILDQVKNIMNGDDDDDDTPPLVD